MLYKNKFKKEDFEFSIDWEYLNRRGSRELREKVEIIIGFGLGTISSFIIALAVVYRLFDTFASGELAIKGFGPLFWFLILLWMFGLYLLRDRDKYWDNSAHHSLDSISEDRKINIAYYLDHDLLKILDHTLNSQDKSNVHSQYLFNLVLGKESVILLFDRLGIDERVADDMLDALKNEFITLESLLKDTFINAMNIGFEYVDERALFVTLVERSEGLNRALKKNKIFDDDWDSLIVWLKTEELVRKLETIWKFKKSLRHNFKYNRSFTNVSIPDLERFGKDITFEVKVKNEFNLSLSREKELKEIVTQLGKKNSNILLIGEPGVGKSTLLKSLAVKILTEEVPQYLDNMRLVEFNFNKALVSSKDPDEFMKTFNQILEGLEKAKNVILVIDNFEQLLNLKKELSAEVRNFMISAAESNDFLLIATTTQAGYSKYISNDNSLNRIFSKIVINEPSDSIAKQILIDESKVVAGELGVTFKVDAISAAVDLSSKYYSDRVMPDKGLDLLKEAASFEIERSNRTIDSSSINKVLSKRMGVKVGGVDEEEKDRIRAIEEKMKARVIGQNHAIDSVISALKRDRYGIRDNTKPIASFLFAGPTGVGKTEVARTLAREWFGSEKSMIRLDMSEYQEEQNVSRLLGYKTPNGDYIDGFLTESVRKHPYSLVLLDEIEKANSKVLDLFLQVLDDGNIKDGLNREIDFDNCVIIATSNVGSKSVYDEVEQDFATIKKLVMKEIENSFRIEFLNRFDEVIVFRSLGVDDMKKIAQIILRQRLEKLQKQGVEFEITNDLIDRIVKQGASKVWGARELKRVIDKEIEKLVLK